MADASKTASRISECKTFDHTILGSDCHDSYKCDSLGKSKHRLRDEHCRWMSMLRNVALGPKDYKLLLGIKLLQENSGRSIVLCFDYLRKDLPDLINNI